LHAIVFLTLNRYTFFTLFCDKDAL